VQDVGEVSTANDRGELERRKTARARASAQRRLMWKGPWIPPPGRGTWAARIPSSPRALQVHQRVRRTWNATAVVRAPGTWFGHLA
jgi:hypothetical protein